MMYGLYSNYGGWGAGSMMGLFGGGIIMIVFWVLIVTFIIWVLREFGNKNINSDSKALSILKERFAKGEIDKEEFEEKKKDLMK